MLSTHTIIPYLINLGCIFHSFFGVLHSKCTMDMNFYFLNVVPKPKSWKKFMCWTYNQKKFCIQKSRLFIPLPVHVFLIFINNFFAWCHGPSGIKYLVWFWFICHVCIHFQVQQELHNKTFCCKVGKWGTLNTSPANFLGVVDLGRGSRPERNPIFWNRLKTSARPSDFEKTIALAFLKVTYPQIPYWVHFTFKIHNPHKYIHFHWVNKAIDWDITIKVKPSI